MRLAPPDSSAGRPPMAPRPPVCAARHEQASRTMGSLYRQVQSDEARLRQAEQDTPPAQTSPSECAKQREEQVSEGEIVLPAAGSAAADGRQAKLGAIASDLLYWKGGLKVLRQAQLPKWRGSFQWQIEAQIEALQAGNARLRRGLQGGRIGSEHCHDSSSAAHNAPLPFFKGSLCWFVVIPWRISVWDVHREKGLASSLLPMRG